MADKSEKSAAKAEEETAARRHPAQIPKIFDSGDVETVRREFRALYGYDQSAQFVTDLMAFIEKVKRGDYVE